MIDSRFAAFCGIVAVLTVTPGPDMAVIARVALRSGRRAAWVTVFGIHTGMIGWVLASALGVAAVLATSATAFTALRLAGAAYLVYLGARTWLHTRRREHDDESSTGTARRDRPFRMGLLSNLLNPKVALIYMTIIPQFVARGDLAVPRSLFLAATLSVMALSWQLTYAAVVARLGNVLSGPRARRLIERITAVALVAFGVRLGAQQ